MDLSYRFIYSLFQVFVQKKVYKKGNDSVENLVHGMLGIVDDFALVFNIYHCLSILDLVGVGSHVTALGQYYVLTMMESFVLGFLEHPEDGKLTQQRWNVLKNSRLETGFAFVQLLHLQSMD